MLVVWVEHREDEHAQDGTLDRLEDDLEEPGESIIAVAHTFVALVTGEHEGEIVGLVTATDALEAVMGEIEVPLDIQLQSRSRNS